MKLTIEIPNSQASFMLELLKKFTFVEVKEKIEDAITPQQTPQNILRLKGLGKEIWQNIDVENYVRTERETWD